jgi:ribosomal protein S18 acetylase RimI-like enzyme
MGASLHEPVAVIIRPATESDIPVVAATKVEAWRHAYRGLVPAPVLDAMTAEEVRSQWLDIDAGAFASSVLIAESDSDIAGYAMFGPVRDGAPGYDGQLYAIYLRPAALRRGVGTALFRAASDGLRAQGHANFLLWVFEANTAARRFYERQGGSLIPGAHIVTEIGGAHLPELAYGFPATGAV